MQDSVSSNGTPSARAAADDLGLCWCPRKARRSAAACARPSDSARAIARAELRRRVGKRVVRERADHEAIDAGRRAVDGRLAEQDDVAARQIHVFVGRVIRQAAVLRPPNASPRTRRACRRASETSGRARPSQRALASKRDDHRALGRLPGEADADVDGLHRRRDAASSATSTALSRPPESRYRRWHLGNWVIW